MSDTGTWMVCLGVLVVASLVFVDAIRAIKASRLSHDEARRNLTDRHIAALNQISEQYAKDAQERLRQVEEIRARIYAKFRQKSLHMPMTRAEKVRNLAERSDNPHEAAAAALIASELELKKLK